MPYGDLTKLLSIIFEKIEERQNKKPAYYADERLEDGGYLSGLYAVKWIIEDLIDEKRQAERQQYSCSHIGDWSGIQYSASQCPYCVKV